MTRNCQVSSIKALLGYIYTVVPYLEPLTKNRLAEAGEVALGHLCKPENMIVAEEGAIVRERDRMHPKSPGAKDIARGETKAFL